MAAAFGAILGVGSGSGSGSSTRFRNLGKKGNRRNNNIGFGFRVLCVSSSSSLTSDPYKTLKIRPGASESEIKKAYRRLALKYHPDVCRGSNCGIEFHQINEAYDIVMNNLKNEAEEEEVDEHYYEEGELWEEWMGWEGAGIRDYTSHINPYI